MRRKPEETTLCAIPPYSGSLRSPWLDYGRTLRVRNHQGFASRAVSLDFVLV